MAWNAFIGVFLSIRVGSFCFGKIPPLNTLHSFDDFCFPAHLNGPPQRPVVSGNDTAPADGNVGR
ncbi:hypothetical protein, partial [Streptomyces sp. NPDC056244]|uniref:hypothetical protein n=1 Tax=Streptomyces sp. NPDC056244 TaxID=3345762 RepID=UPI0035D5B546